MTHVEIKRARGKCTANALVCQLCWIFLAYFPAYFHLQTITAASLGSKLSPAYCSVYKRYDSL